MTTTCASAAVLAMALAIEGADLKFNRIEIGHVRAGGDIGARIDLAIEKNFLALDIEGNFLQPFRFRKAKEEAVAQQDRFRGLGLQIHAAVQFARYSGDPRVAARKKSLVEETIRTQSPSGYIGVYKEEPDGAQLWREFCFHDATYIVLGLAEDYRYFGNRAALDAARRLGGYLMSNWPRRSRELYFTTLGAAEAFFALHELTGDKTYLRFAADEPMGKKYRILPATLTEWQQELYPARRLAPEQIAAESPVNRVGVDSCHMYRIFERAMMQLRLHRIEPRSNLPLMSRRILAAMTRPEKAGMLITGSTGLREGWDESQDGGGRQGETCATVYGMWLLDELARQEGDLRYGDLIERALFNAFFAAQDPAGRRLRYFTPFSGKRDYYEFEAFCCPNNFRRGIGSLPKLIYHASGGAVGVNLYVSSRALLDVGGGRSLELRQETDYPSSGNVDITLRPPEPARFALRLRIPHWSIQTAVSVNGEAEKRVRPGQPFHEIERQWKPGDRVKLRMPMTARFVKGTEMQAGRAALMRGPVVYCLNPKRNPSMAGLPLREITLDPKSLTGPFPDREIRTGGQAFRIRGWRPGASLEQPADLTLLLSEFPDPGGEEIYFRLSHPAAAVEDELTGRYP